MFCILQSEDSAILGVIMGLFGIFLFSARFIRCHSAYFWIRWIGHIFV